MKLLATAALMLALTSTHAAAQDTPSAHKSHAVLYGTLIGAAAGVAGGALFFGLRIAITGLIPEPRWPPVALSPAASWPAARSRGT